MHMKQHTRYYCNRKIIHREIENRNSINMCRSIAGNQQNEVTLVTGLWNIGRSSLENWSRKYQNYLDMFANY